MGAGENARGDDGARDQQSGGDQTGHLRPPGGAAFRLVHFWLGLRRRLFTGARGNELLRLAEDLLEVIAVDAGVVQDLFGDDVLDTYGVLKPYALSIKHEFLALVRGRRWAVRPTPLVRVAVF
ncbi:hypothetical protein H074_16337 [Amycolatopsis decaplanina DSM 44594]|uniref:Uncharacterized protein n=1 Tax=Amycolatopsis decaplanina DSM 44594 TaxID=1284240 RepID=M2YFY9_9PSEU|nr:hypothetical protein H074_16337 [Amycolatopsis decaplanina DSM 44594]